MKFGEFQEAQATIRRLVSDWPLSEFYSRGEEEMSSGLRSRAYDGPEPRRSAETTLPVSGADGGPKDPHDRHILLERKRVLRKLGEIQRLCEDVHSITRDRLTVLNPEYASMLARDGLGQTEECARCFLGVKGSGRSDDRLYAAKNGERVCFGCYRKDQKNG